MFIYLTNNPKTVCLKSLLGHLQKPPRSHSNSVLTDFIDLPPPNHFLEGRVSLVHAGVVVSLERRDWGWQQDLWQSAITIGLS